MTSFKEYVTSALERARRATPGPWHIGHVSETTDAVEIDSADLKQIAVVFERRDQPLVASCRTDVEVLSEACSVLLEVLEPANEYLKQFICDGTNYNGACDPGVDFHDPECCIAKDFQKALNKVQALAPKEEKSEQNI